MTDVVPGPHEDLYQHYDGDFWTVCSCGQEFGGTDPDEADYHQQLHALDEQVDLEAFAEDRPTLVGRPVTKLMPGPYVRSYSLDWRDRQDLLSAIHLAITNRTDDTERLEALAARLRGDAA